VAAGALGFAACALFAGMKWMDVVQARGRAHQQAQEAHRAADAYARITATFPVTNTSTENLKVAVTEFTRIAQRGIVPERIFAHLSRVLEEFPQFEIDSLKWGSGRPGEARDARSGTPPVKPDAQGEVETVEVSGRVNATQRSDYRGITAQVQRFAAALGTAGFQLTRTQLPFDVTSEGTLTGDIGGAETDAPRFTIVFTRKMP
jgi:hypothetical protein